MKIAIITLLKNEQWYLEEWLEHHKNIGDIYVYEDEGSKSHKEITDKYSNVYLFNIKDILPKINRPTIQTDFANKFIHTHDYDWTAFIDVDEFICGDLKLLNKYNSSILMPWHNYNANGHFYKPQGGVVENYTQPCGNNTKDKNIWITKVFAKGKSPTWKNVHWTNDAVKQDEIYIKHYITKSFEEFCWKTYERGEIYGRIYRGIPEFLELNPDFDAIKCRDYVYKKYKIKIGKIMTTNEAIAKYNFISKVLMKDGNDELSKELKIKIMSMRIELSKVKKSFDEDCKEFAEQIITDDFRNLAQKQDKTEEEKTKYLEEEAKINEAYAGYINQRSTKEVEINTEFTADEYNEIVGVNASNDVEINGAKIPAGDFLEILYNLFVKE